MAGSAAPVGLPHHQRVMDEKRELDDRREKLARFYLTEAFRALPEVERSLLFRQGDAMRSYSQVLGERIELFGLAI